MFTVNLSLYKYKSFWIYGILCLFPLLSFWQVGFMQYVMKWDLLDQFFPYRYFISECFKSGILPAWNPYQHLGWPFHADPQSGFWYPISWIIAVTSGYSIYTIQFEWLLHVIIAGLGFYVFLRGVSIDVFVALLFSVAYQSCGLFVSNAQHLTWIVAMAWLPWVLHSYFKMTERLSVRYACSTALFLFFMLTGGYPIFSLITNYFLIVYFLTAVFSLIRKHEMKSLYRLLAVNALVYVLFVLLSAGYLISFLEVLPYISRAAGLSLHEAQEGAFEWRALLSFFVPYSVTRNDGSFTTDLSMLNVYAGFISLGFALYGLRLYQNKIVRLFGIFGAVCFMASLGNETPVRSLMYHYLPFMDSFRFPAIFRVFFVFSLLVIGALSMNTLIQDHNKLKKTLLVSSATWMLILVALFIYSQIIKYSHILMGPFWNPEKYYGILNNSSLYDRIATQSLTQLILGLIFFGIVFSSKRLHPLLITIFIFHICDLWWNTQMNVPATVVSEVKASTFHQQLKTFPSGFPIPEHIPIKDNPAYDARLYPSWHNQNIFLKRISAEGFNSFYLSDFMKFYDSSDKDNVLRNPLLYSENANALKKTDVIEFSPNHIKALVECDSAGNLTYLQSRYKGWKVYVNHRQQKLSVSAIPFLSVNIPAGKNKVEFRYEPYYVLPLFLMSIILLTACIISLLIGYMKAIRTLKY